MREDVMFCLNCGKEHDNEGLYCPECAAAQAAQMPAAEQLSEQAPPAAEEIPEETVPVIEKILEEAIPVIEEATPEASAPAEAENNLPVDQPKKKKKGLFVGLAVAALALVGGIVALVLNWSNWFGDGIPKDPAEYVAFLEEPRMEDTQKALEEAYGAIKNTEIGALCQDSVLEIESSQAFWELITESDGQSDFSWLSNITLNIRSNEAPDRMAKEIIVKLLIGGEHILTVDQKTDYAALAEYLAIPELNSEYLMLDYTELLSGVDVQARNDLQQELIDALPEAEAVGEAVAAFHQIVLKYITADVSKQTQTITVNGVEKKVTALQSKLTELQILEMYEEIIVLLQENEAARQMVQAYVNYAIGYAEAMGLTAEDAGISQEDFQQTLEDALAEIQEGKEITEPTTYVILDTYASGKEVLGYGIHSFADDEEEFFAWAAAVTVDGVTHLEIWVDDTAVIRGQSTQDKEGLVNGQYALSVSDHEYLTLEMKNVSAESGYGVYVLAPKQALLELMELEDLAEEPVSLELEIREEGGKFTLLAGDKSLLSLDMTATVSEGQAITMPQGVEATDDTAVEAWLMNVKLEGVVESVKAAGLPQEDHVAADGLVQQWNELLAQMQMAKDLVGTWKGSLDMDEILNEAFRDGGVTFEGLTMDIILRLEADETYTVEYDQLSVEAMAENAADQVIAALEQLLRTEANAYGMSLTELLRYAGYSSMDDYLEDMGLDRKTLKQDLIDSVGQGDQGEYWADPQEMLIYMDWQECPFALEGDTLTLTLNIFIVPVEAVLERVA